MYIPVYIYREREECRETCMNVSASIHCSLSLYHFLWNECYKLCSYYGNAIAIIYLGMCWLFILCVIPVFICCKETKYLGHTGNLRSVVSRVVVGGCCDVIEIVFVKCLSVVK
jgi:hypothetical protein